MIQAATNRSELFNRYAQCVSLGGSGLAIAAERNDQLQVIRCNHLVTNLLIFHTAVGMMRTVDEIAADGTALRSHPRRWPAPNTSTPSAATNSTSARRPRRCGSSCPPRL